MLNMIVPIAFSGLGFLAGLSQDRDCSSATSKVARFILGPFKYAEKKSSEHTFYLLATGCAITLIVAPCFALARITHNVSIIVLKNSALYTCGLIIGDKAQENYVVKQAVKACREFFTILKQGGFVTAAALEAIKTLVTHPLGTSKNALKVIQREIHDTADLLRKASQVDFSQTILSGDTQSILRNAAEIDQYLLKFQENRKKINGELERAKENMSRLRKDFNQKVAETQGATGSDKTIHSLEEEIKGAELESQKLQQSLDDLDKIAEGLRVAADSILKWHGFVLKETNLPIKERVIARFYDQDQDQQFVGELFSSFNQDASTFLGELFSAFNQGASTNNERLNSLKEVYEHVTKLKEVCEDQTKLTAMKRRQFSEKHQVAEGRLKTLTQSSQELAQEKIEKVIKELESGEIRSSETTLFSEEDEQKLQEIMSLSEELNEYFKSHGLDCSEQNWSAIKELVSSALLGGALFINFGLKTLKTTTSTLSMPVRKSLEEIVSETNRLISGWEEEPVRKLENLASLGMEHILETEKLAKEIAQQTSRLENRAKKELAQLAKIEELESQLHELDSTKYQPDTPNLSETLETQQKKLKNLQNIYKTVSALDQIRYITIKQLADLSEIVELPALKHLFAHFLSADKEEKTPQPKLLASKSSPTPTTTVMLQNYHKIANPEDIFTQLRQTELQHEPQFLEIEGLINRLARLRAAELEKVRQSKATTNIEFILTATSTASTLKKISELTKKLEHSLKQKYNSGIIKTGYKARNGAVNWLLPRFSDLTNFMATAFTPTESDRDSWDSDDELFPNFGRGLMSNS